MGQKIILKNPTNTFIGLSLAGLFTLGLAGCAAAPVGDSAAEPTVISSSETEVEIGCSMASPGDYGDVIPLEDVIDEYGTYCHVTIDPDSDALVYDASKVDLESLAEFGFTEKQAEMAQQNAVRFVVEEALDSPMLDSKDPEAVSTWAQTNESLFSGDWDVAATTGIVYTGTLPVLIRDGSPRAAETTTAVEKVYAVEHTTRPGAGVVVVQTNSIAKFRMSDEMAIEFSLFDDATATRESVLAQNPSLNDGIENVLAVDVTYKLGFNSLGQISGVSFVYQTAPKIVNNS